VVESLVTVICPEAAPAALGSNCTCRVTDWFGFSVTGKLAPETLKPGPVTVAALMVTGALPVDVSVTGWVDPTFNGTLPKFTVVGLTVNCGVVLVVPDPPSETVAGPEGSSLVTVSVPASAPAVVGSKVTVTDNCWLGCNVTGSDTAPTLNAVPGTVIALIFRGAFPVDVNVSARETLVPIALWPKSMDVVERARLGAGTASPVPLSGTFAVPPLASLATARSPVKEAAESGAKAMDRTTCCPGFSVAGQPVMPAGYVTDESPNACPAAVLDEIVTGAVPDEVNVSCSAAFEPICTWPKFRLGALTVRAGEVSCTPVPVSDTLTGEPVSVERLNCPLLTPVAVGSKATLNVTTWPG
jgi:hypothetical protein